MRDRAEELLEEMLSGRGRDRCECVVPGCPGCEWGARAKALRQDVERRQAQFETAFREAFGLVERSGHEGR